VGPIQHLRLWLWKAWSRGRTRLCDCGWVRAEDEKAARAYARSVVGGPWKELAAEFEIREIA